MKIYTLALVFLSFYIPSLAQDLDTVWTHDIGQYNNNSNCARFMPDGKSIIAGVGNTLYEFETSSGKFMRMFSSPQIPQEKNIISLEISYNGKTLVGKAYNGEPYYWSYEQGKCIDIFSTKDLTFYNPYSFVFHPFENSIFAIVNDTLLKYDFNTMKTGKFAKLSKMGLSKIAISKDAKYLALSYDYKNSIDQKQHSSLELWDADSLTQIRQLDDITRDVRAIAFSPNSQKLVFLTSQVEGCFVRIYDLVNDKKEILSWDFLGIEPFGAIFCNDTNTIFLTGLDINKNRISKLYNIDSGKTYNSIPYGFNQAGIDYNRAENICISSLYKLVCLDSKYIKTGIDKNSSQINNCLSAFVSGDYLNIKNTCGYSINRIIICNINGKLVKTYDAGYSGATVALPFSAPAGVYLVRIVTDRSDYNFKFVRE